MPKGKERPQAACHPEKLNKARGLCDNCYARWRTRQNPFRHLMIRYGMTQQEYERRIQLQEHCCAICHSENPLHKQGAQLFVIDHNHDTGKVRGILCSRCNKALGLFKDDSILLQAAINYLEDTSDGV